MVIIEDVDAIAHRRSGSSDSSLADFLNALDGVGRTDAAILTVMTTNDLETLDAASRRAGRIDVVLEVPAPTFAARQRILQGLLSPISNSVDVDRVARESDGRTAADLREVVRSAAFANHSGPITTVALLDRLEGLGHDAGHGVYL